MISVIVPVYKAEQTIARCIKSVIIQEYKDWELILVDDGSPDKSGEICEEYARKDKRIRVIHQKNAGASAARNHGMEEVCGEYICFIDSDDYVSSKYLMDFSTDGKQIGFAIQGMTSIYPIRQAQYDRIPSNSSEVNISSLLCESSVHELLSGPCCKLYRTDVIKEHSIVFPIDISYGEDEIFVKQYLCHSPNLVSIVAKSNYFYIKENPTSLSGKKRDGLNLYNSVAEDYSYFLKLSSRFEIPPIYNRFYRNHKANDFFSSLYLVMMDRQFDLTRINQFISQIKPELLFFFIEEHELPILYRLICVFLKIRIKSPLLSTLLLYIVLPILRLKK